MDDTTNDSGWRGSRDLWLQAAYQALLEGGVDAVKPWDKKGFKLPGGPIQSPAGFQFWPAANAIYRRETHDNYPGARGLLTHAVGTDDDTEALMLAEKVRSVDPNAAWVLPKLFDLQVRARNWSAADATMSEAIKRLAVSAEKGRRLRALVLYERGLASSEMSDDEAAVGFFREALDLDASLPRIAIEYSKLLLKIRLSLDCYIQPVY